MGVKVREKVKGSGTFWVFVHFKNKRVSQQVGTLEAAELTKSFIEADIKRGKFAIESLKPEPKPEKPAVVHLPNLQDFYSQTVAPLWEASLAKSTAERYETSFRLHINPALGDVPLHELTRDRVKRFVVSLLKKPAEKRARTEEKNTKEQERRLSKDSIRNIIAALRGALTEAIERELIGANPASKLGRVYRESGKVREEVDPFTATEIPSLLKAMLEHYGQNNYALLLTALHTGLRSSEMAGLQWNDIDFREKLLTVRRQYKDGVTSRTKTRKHRKVDISDVLLKELQALKKRRQEEYLGRGKNEIPEWVFMSPGNIIWEDGKQIGRKEGEPVDMVNFRNRVYLKACDRAGIRRRRLHDTRHTFASILLMAGESPAYVKEQLGHSSIKVTVDVYGHFIPGANRQAVNKLPSLTSKTSADVCTEAAAN